MTRLLVQPVINGAGRSDALATARWDAFNLLFDIDTKVTPKQDYRYDPFRRRIATLELGGPDGNEIQPGSRRFIYCGWEDVEERLFDSGATLASAPSRLERIYVNGREIDEPLLSAIDSNGDRALGGLVPKNVPDTQADQEYYFLNNRLGSIMALVNADQADRVLEHYRYSVYGEPTVLQAIDLNRDHREDTPFDRADNSTLLAPQPGSAFGNIFVFTSRRLDSRTGLYYYRHRYYDPHGGRFISRDPKGYRDGLNTYVYVKNSAVNLVDPLGLDFQYLGWKWGTPKKGVKAQVFPYYQVRLECKCINGYWYIRFSGADVRVRIIINKKPGNLRLKEEYETMRNRDPTDDPRDGSGNAVSPTALSYQNTAGETIPTAFGIYGHELRHVESIREAYDRAMADGSKLRNEIARMEKIAQGKRLEDCREKIAEKGEWRERLLQLLKEAIDEGAGHDTEDATTKPEDGRTYEPPGGVMPAPLTQWEKLTAQGYTQYQELND